MVGDIVWVVPIELLLIEGSPSLARLVAVQELIRDGVWTSTVSSHMEGSWIRQSWEPTIRTLKPAGVGMKSREDVPG